MAETIQIKVVTPSGSHIEDVAASVTARSVQGEFCILPMHRPILAAIAPGRLIVESTDGAKTTYALDRGFLEGGPDHVNVITQRCVAATEIDVDATKTEIEDIEGKLAALEPGQAEFDNLNAALDWAKARLGVGA